MPDKKLWRSTPEWRGNAESEPLSERERRLLHAAKNAKTALDMIRGLGMFPKFTALHTACDALSGVLPTYAASVPFVPETAEYTKDSAENARIEVGRLLCASQWFACTPLPDDRYRFTVKVEHVAGKAVRP